MPIDSEIDRSGTVVLELSWQRAIGVKQGLA